MFDRSGRGSREWVYVEELQCKGSEAGQQSAFGQLEEVSHGKFVHILQVFIQTCPLSLSQGDLHSLLSLEALQCLLLKDLLHY